MPWCPSRRWCQQSGQGMRRACFTGREDSSRVSIIIDRRRFKASRLMIRRLYKCTPQWTTSQHWNQRRINWLVLRQVLLTLVWRRIRTEQGWKLLSLCVERNMATVWESLSEKSWRGWECRLAKQGNLQRQICWTTIRGQHTWSIVSPSINAHRRFQRNVTHDDYTARCLSLSTLPTSGWQTRFIQSLVWTDHPQVIIWFLTSEGHRLATQTEGWTPSRTSWRRVMRVLPSMSLTTNEPWPQTRRPSSARRACAASTSTRSELTTNGN